MPDQPADKGSKLEKLGQRIRDGFSREHPTPDHSRETVRQTIRQEWEKERAAKSPKLFTPTSGKDLERKPEEPDQER